METPGGREDQRARPISRSFLKRGLGRTLLFWFLFLSLLPLLIVSAISYLNAREALRDIAYNSLRAVTELKTAYINSYFMNVFTDLDNQANAISNVQLLESLRDAFKSSGKPLADFVKSYRWESIVHDKAADLVTFSKIYGYYDVLIIDTDGNVLYSVKRESDLGTNLYENSELLFSKKFNQALQSGKAVFSDFYRYVPSGNELAGFFLSVLLNEDGDKVGTIVFQIPMAEIDHIMWKKSGLGKTEESYLVGTDLKMRSNSRLTQGSTALGDFIDTKQTRLWQRSHGASGSPVEDSLESTMSYLGYRGSQVYGAHQTIEVGGIRLGVISEIETAEALEPATSLGRIVLMLFLLTFIVVAIAAVLSARRIIRPVLALSAGAERISGGDLEQEISVTARNEIGELAHSFNDMQFNLRENREKVAAQDWLKTGQAELNESMRGELDIGTLGRNIIDYLAEFLQIQLGALYLAEESGHLKMIGSHAYSQRKTVSNDFAPGEGLVGQAALERKPIVISNCPDDYITIRSGLGESVPRNILVFPLVMNEETKGVIELGSFEAFSEAQMEFLGVVGSSIAITLHAARARTRTVELLEQTQRQSRELQAQQEQLQAANEELQTQQEELKTTNEELEEQAQRLKASEESLQSQQEEMEVTNEELEEKNKLLERQSQEVEQAREEIEQKARELAQASKYKSEFLANMSHELRSPLNSLLLLAESLKNNPEGNLSPEQIESAGIIYGSGNDLLSLINEILDLSKIEAGRMDLNPELVRPTELANNARALFYHLAEEKGLKLEISVSETAPAQLTTDRQRVEQIIKNLVSNAIKFTEQGSVAISFGRPDAAANLQASGLTVDQTLAIAVKDSGIGVPPDKQQMIFQAFQQADGSTSRRYGGTGLGLSISSELAHMLGGEIQLESEPGTGSTFTLYLPLEVPVTDTEQPPPATQVEVISAEPQQDTPPATAKTMPDVVFPDDRESLQKGDDILLIIEDDPKFARILYQRAHEHRFHGVVALNGEEGIELARQLLPAAITLDLQLPGMDGWTVLSILKDAPDTRHIPVHIISVEESDIETRRRGAIGHLTKPASQADIEQVFQQFKELSRKQSKRLLVVEDDDTERRNLVGILDEDNAVIDEVTSGEEAWKALHEAQYDCVILDLGLGDMDGSELLRRLSAEAEVEIPPVIVYTARNLTHEEELELREYASSIILKDVRSQERLLDEVSLFLHSVVSELPEQKQRIITNLHDTDAVFRDRKVLVVDDDMRTVFAITRLLSAHGIKALKAENGLKALELLDREPDVELVLTDIMMPEMDGYETIARIREQDRFNKLPVIALTAKAMKEDRERCLTAGASDYLTKPLDQDRLLSMMRVWLSR